MAESNSESISKARFDENGEATVGGYSAWLEKHPSALVAFDRIKEQLEGKSLAVFLDYDGTLSPIVNDPEKAFMSDEMRSAVEEVGYMFPTAIVSGRRRNKVEEFVQLKNVTYAGSHGMDILTSSGSLSGLQHQIREVDEKVLKVLKERTEVFEGSSVEDNLFCVSVHYRCAKPQVITSHPEKDSKHSQNIIYALISFHYIQPNGRTMYLKHEIDTLKEMVKSTMEEYPNFCIKEGKMVIKELCRGFSIVVSSYPKETEAAYSLRDPTEVMTFLKELAKSKRNY
ncbi:hypothetical protein Tsubulata_026373 [Turnera subulata]|uniref:Trehalose 6-phosphate phosphatase n=1 Tax=Turnera subulata TaxID=218843 RepID=A0A9Q0JD96_9ROSI|nr:hypothetical protein Tsubulata_026373 [Turnera subulata]